MTAVKYLFAFWVGILVYALISILLGINGVSAYAQLQTELDKQEANIQNLKLINRELEDTMNSLLYDKETMAVLAREKGYASRQERFIRIVGLRDNQKTRISAGEVVAAVEPQYAPDRTVRTIAVCTGISIIICMAFFDLMKNLRER